MLVLFYVGEDINFIDSAFLKLLVFLEAPHLDHLNRILLIVILVNRPIHLTICSLPDYLVQRVVLDYPHHYFCLLIIIDCCHHSPIHTIIHIANPKAPLKISSTEVTPTGTTIFFNKF